MRVSIFDYGAGNLHSLAKAIERSDTEVRLETDPAAAVVDTDVLILPGVGAFGAAAARLAPGRDAMREALENGLPCLGICLGMQLLFDHSEEGIGSGLGLLPGAVTRIAARRVPHIGWNTIEDTRDALFDSAPLPMAYFANGYVCRPESTASVIAWTTHESDRFPAAVRHRRTIGVQFHPEKSSNAGVRFVHAFLDEVNR
jgi:imidazole glycerol-phosphate synthase subunit HisH